MLILECPILPGNTPAPLSLRRSYNPNALNILLLSPPAPAFAMSPVHRHTDETRPLLRDGSPYPESYRSLDSDLSQPQEPCATKISRADLIWVLAGLWSAVFLGALDGASAVAYPSHTPLHTPCAASL